ncbi:hypothetical protein HanIR_Chr05g0229741 [Helianthus annuus]|nr:hypothetical protein HanIR_Chr05g0229741 [Helianthus annuus]
MFQYIDRGFIHANPCFYSFTILCIIQNNKVHKHRVTFQNTTTHPYRLSPSEIGFVKSHFTPTRKPDIVRAIFYTLERFFHHFSPFITLKFLHKLPVDFRHTTAHFFNKFMQWCPRITIAFSTCDKDQVTNRVFG